MFRRRHGRLTEAATSILVFLTPVVIRIFFAVLVLCTVAVVAVILAVHFRVKRHLEVKTTAAQDEPKPDVSAVVVAPSGEKVTLPPAGNTDAGSPKERV